MMPTTVPNRPTNGAVAPIVPSIHSRVAQVLIDAQPLAVHRGHDVLGLGAAEPLVADEEHVGDRRRRALARRASLLERAAREAARHGVTERCARG